MAKSPNSPAAALAAPPPPAQGWTTRTRLLVSLAVFLHLAIVVLATYTAAPPYSQLAQQLSEPFRPYINALDLNHGYRFFAPDPGPSHLVRYHLQWADGHGRDGVFPNLEEERPRLLYHRYFMLSEHLNGLAEMAHQLPEGSPTRRDADAGVRGFAKSFADELMRRTGATQVHLELVEHGIPTPEEFAAGRRLDDKSLFQVLDLGTFAAGTP